MHGTKRIGGIKLYMQLYEQIKLRPYNEEQLASVRLTNHPLCMVLNYEIECGYIDCQECKKYQKAITNVIYPGLLK